MQSFARALVSTVAASILVVACSAAPPTSVTGNWTGTWKSDDPSAVPSSGTVAIVATQTGSTVTGTGTVSPLGSGALSKSLYVSGRWTGTISAAIGSVSFDANVAGESVSGTYTTIAGDKGSFNLSRKSGG
jgi:hypothetical protein